MTQLPGPPPGYPAVAQPHPYPQYYYVPVGPPPPISPAGAPLADFGTRLLAYIIDALLVGAVAFVYLIVAGIMLGLSLAGRPTTDDPNVFLHQIWLPLLLIEAGFFVLYLLVYYLYEVEFMHRSGQTLGKKAMKIRVVPIDPSARLTRGMAARRYLVQHVAGMFVPFFSYVDGLWQLWDKPYLQTLHDKAAQTVVVKVSA
ncbi:RDD family protein [Actinoplanes sp. NPDC051513]|uniref:RDD family protein n=1 Tax=Actinoplanes sp. NPDC051513 TaxID=3363908 RepID=UPI0037B78C0B